MSGIDVATHDDNNDDGDDGDDGDDEDNNDTFNYMVYGLRLPIKYLIWSQNTAEQGNLKDVWVGFCEDIVI
jgi:hypothetical protein